MSFVSSCSPSYSIGGLASPTFVDSTPSPLKSPLDSLFPSSNRADSVPVSKKKEDSPPKPKEKQQQQQPSQKKQDEGIPIQYQKLKMNYFRRLNVIPIINPENVRFITDKKKTLSGTKQQNEGLKTIEKTLPKKTNSKFTQSFLPARSHTSTPISIPVRKNASRFSSDDDGDDDGKQMKGNEDSRSNTGAFPGSQSQGLANEIYGIFDVDL